MSVFVIDNELTNSIKEFGSIIDQLQESPSYSESISPLIDENTNEIKDKSQLIKVIYQGSSAEYMTKLNDKEFEPTFNLIIYILSELEGGLQGVFVHDCNTLINNLIETSPTHQLSLRDRKSIKATSILSELSLIFNLLPRSSEFRAFVVEKIITFTKTANLDYKILEQSFKVNLIGWLVEANCSHEQIKSIFFDFVELDPNFSSDSLKSIYDLSKKFEISLKDLKRIINFALSSETIDLSFLINSNINKAIEQNKSDPTVSLFVSYLNGEIIENDQYPNLSFKTSILALCKYFEKSDKFEFTFSEIPVDSEQLEILLINAIKYGLVEGKLDQVNETFHLTRINKFILPSDDELVKKNLNDVRSNLLNWQRSLSNVNEVVNNFRENIK